MPPTSDEQIRFLVSLQRLLDEGLFTASYKFALLVSLADLSVEKGEDSGSPLTLTTDEIAAKFVRYYWRQVVPYVKLGGGKVLQQNTGRQQATIVQLVQAARQKHGDSLASAIHQSSSWKRLVRKVAGVVREMPLWKLQTVGREKLEFLLVANGRPLPRFARC